MRRIMSVSCVVAMVLVLAGGALWGQERTNPFAGKTLPKGWTWKRENPYAWRLKDGGLEIKIEPGNMWGRANNAKNVLLVPLAQDLVQTGTEVQATFANVPTKRWEQVDLVWYYRDSHMVKIGLELEHGKNSVVMGREENDRTRTIKIVPLEVNQVTVRLTVRDGQVRGDYRLKPKDKWVFVGTCTEPKPADGHEKPKVSLQCYQGDPENPKWARITEFKTWPITETGAENDAAVTSR